jgi:hypothetical protein
LQRSFRKLLAFAARGPRLLSHRPHRELETKYPGAFFPTLQWPASTGMLAGPRNRAFTKDGPSFTREGSGSEFMWGFEEEVQSHTTLAIGETQFVDLSKRSEPTSRVNANNRSRDKYHNSYDH